jgi:hypothetical protein
MKNRGVNAKCRGSVSGQNCGRQQLLLATITAIAVFAGTLSALTTVATLAFFATFADGFSFATIATFAIFAGAVAVFATVAALTVIFATAVFRAVIFWTICRFGFFRLVEEATTGGCCFICVDGG